MSKNPIKNISEETALIELKKAYEILTIPSPQGLIAPNPCDIYNKIKFAIPAAILISSRIPIFGKYIAEILTSLSEIAQISCPTKV